MANTFTIDLNSAPMTADEIAAELDQYSTSAQRDVDRIQNNARTRKYLYTGIYLLIACAVLVGPSEMDAKIFYWCFLGLFIVMNFSRQHQRVIDEVRKLHDGKKKFLEISPVSRLNARILDLSQEHLTISRYVNAVANQRRLLVKAEYYAFIHFDSSFKRSTAARQIYSVDDQPIQIAPSINPGTRKISI